MTKPLQQCMGGWCTPREKCAHYWAPQQIGVPPSERLCTADGELMALRPGELVDDGRAAERERLSTDQRFAQWAAVAES